MTTINGMAPSNLHWGLHARTVLKRAGYRAGGARNAVVEFLDDQECCVSPQELFDGLRAEGRSVSISSIYRSLEQLTDLNLVHRIDFGGVTRFEAALPDGEHHHHLVCDGCGALETFDDPEIERALVRVAEARGYHLEGHEVLLRGSCDGCRAG